MKIKSQAVEPGLDTKFTDSRVDTKPPSCARYELGENMILILCNFTSTKVKGLSPSQKHRHLHTLRKHFLNFMIISDIRVLTTSPQGHHAVSSYPPADQVLTLQLADTS